jgi:ATP-dependent DNA ligase
MWWTYPQKPVRINLRSLGVHPLNRYWLEKKYDGHRAILIVDGGQRKLFTRQRFSIAVAPELTAQLGSLKLEEGTVLDGEIWNPLKRGGWTADGREPSVLTFWDCMRDGAKDMSSRPLEERRAALVKAVGDGNEGVRVVEQEAATEARVKEIYEESSTVRKENRSRSGFVHGVVLKLRGSPRRDHATRSKEHSDWLKVVFDDMHGWG